MAIQNTGEADVDFVAGGATSSGVKTGVYHVKVTEVGKGVSKGDEKQGKPKRPFIELTLAVTAKDKIHTSKAGKKLTKTRVYSAHPSDDEEKVQTMMSMVKQKLFDGFGIPWNKDKKKVDPRILQNKEAFVWIDFGKPNEDGESRTDVQNIAPTADKLPKKAREWLESVKGGKAPKEEAEA